ncbi:hypothetical protein Tco_0731193 [Tanacetum coccineum]
MLYGSIGWSVSAKEKHVIASIGDGSFKVRILQKITRQRLKPDNHGHGNGIEYAKAGRMLSKFYPESKSKGKCKLSAWLNNSSDKKTHVEKEICTKSCLKEAQSPLTHGFHVGNPRAPQSNPTMEREHPMIEGMKGQDLWEHLPSSKA